MKEQIGDEHMSLHDLKQRIQRGDIVTRRPSVGLDRRLLKGQGIYFKIYSTQIQVIDI